MFPEHSSWPHSMMRNRIVRSTFILVSCAALLTVAVNMFRSEHELPSLKHVLDDQFITGVAVDTRELVDPYARVVRRQFASLTPENAMKPSAIQPTKGHFTFEAADEIVAFARKHDLKIYGHVMIWHRSTPDWFFERDDGTPLTNAPEDRAIALQHMKTHIEALAARYGDIVWAWDVVNEVVDETTDDGLRRSRWYEILGRDFIGHAFRFARGALPDDVKLFINEHSTENPTKLWHYRKLIERLQDDGVPVDGVGHQFHVRLSTPVDRMEEAIEAFRGSGLVQAVTEFDVALSETFEQVLKENPAGSLERQGYFACNVFAMLKRRSDHIVSVTFWGLHDGRSWLRYLPIRRPAEKPLPFDDNLEPKPFFWGIADPSRLPELQSFACNAPS